MYSKLIRIAKLIRSYLLIGPVWVWKSKLKTLNRGDIHIRKKDNRGKKLIENFGVIDHLVIYLWKNISHKMKPNLYVDVGANYGEVFLSKNYKNGEKLYAIEANKKIYNKLRKSVDTRGDKDKIHLKNEFVGIENEDVKFISDEKWSGTSSAVCDVKDREYKGEGGMEVKEYDMNSKSIGSLVEGIEKEEKVLIKIDVEGAEEKVLRGCIENLKRIKNLIVLMEFSSEKLEKKSIERISKLVGDGMGAYRVNGEGATEGIDICEFYNPEDTFFDEELLLARGTVAKRVVEGIQIPFWVR